MTEKSYFFEPETGFPTGDSEASYDAVDYQLFMSLLLSVDRRSQGPIFTRYNPFFGALESSNLDPANPLGDTDLTIGSGIAICDGVFYANTADIVYDCSAVGYHRIVLRTSRSGGTDQTTRQVALYNAVAYPALTQNANTWEIPIARVKSNGATFDELIDDREFVNNNIYVRARKGDSDTDWSAEGNRPYNVGPTMILCGATGSPPATDMEIEFPHKFAYPPLVFVTPFNYSAGSPTHSAIIYISQIQVDFFTVSVNSTTNIDGYNWVAIGPLYDEAI